MTASTLEEIMDHSADHMSKAIIHLEAEVLKIRAGKATPQMLDGLVVEYYGSPTPIAQVANITSVDARTLTIQPWEKNMLAPIERSIMAANIGVTPQNDGVMIKLFLPPLTEERRKEFIKVAKGKAEDSKVSIRAIRRAAKEAMEKLEKDGKVGKDDLARAEKELEKVTGEHTAKIDELLKHKEAELLEV